MKALQRCMSRWWLCMAVVPVLLGCSSAATVGAGLAASMVEAGSSSSNIKEAQRKAQQQSDEQAYADAQMPSQEETEARYLQLVQQMQQQGLWFASLAHIDALESRWKVSDQSRILRADALRHVGRLQDSESLYKALLRSSQSARALHGLGLLAAGQGQFEQAIGYLEKAQKLQPTDALLLNDLGFALLHTPRSHMAEIPLKQAAQLAPQNLRIQSNVAVYLVLHGKPNEAQRWMGLNQMNEALRLGVFDSAQQIASRQHAAQAGEGRGELQPVPATISDVQQHMCASCLIFEKTLSSQAPAL